MKAEILERICLAGFTRILLFLSTVGAGLFFSGASWGGTTGFTSIVDTEVRSDVPGTNFGKAVAMGIDGSPVRIAYLRFNVSIPAGEVVSKATLKLFMTASSSANGLFVNQVANTNWGETTTTYSNAPALGAQVAASGAFPANAYVSMDVTSLVSGNGLVSLAVRRSNIAAIAFSAREAASNPPRLIVESAPASQSGSLPVGAAIYTVPSGALFVDPAGNDSSSGTQSSPFRTVQRAINVAATGRTIVVRKGTYHEKLKIPSNKTLTIQSYPSEAVWLDGSSVVTGWVKSGATWVKSGWTASFDSTPGFHAGSGGDYRFIDPNYPMASHPDQVWVDGAPLAQVSSAAQVVAGTFYVNYGTDQLVIGSDPTGHTVTASDLSEAIFISSANSKVLGIGIRKFATPSVDVGTVRLAAPGIVLENVVVSDNANQGIFIRGTNVRLNKVTAERNGMIGVAAQYSDNLIVTSLLSQKNNTEHYNMAPESGGFKITRTRGITVRDSAFVDNLGPGLWLDESCYNATVINNMMVGNGKHGMSFEISSLAVIADNVLSNNTSTGLKINDATNVRIYNNTISNNGKNVDLVQDLRRASDLSIPGHDPRRPLPDPTVTWLLGNVQFMNNVVGALTGQYSLYIRDYSYERSAAAMNITVNGNQLTPQISRYLVVWGLTGTAVAVYRTTTEFENGTGQGPGNGDTQATTGPIGLPSDIAALVGQPTGTRHLGPF